MSMPIFAVLSGCWSWVGVVDGIAQMKSKEIPRSKVRNSPRHRQRVADHPVKQSSDLGAVISPHSYKKSATRTV